jgi:hypothetical protein
MPPASTVLPLGLGGCGDRAAPSPPTLTPRAGALESFSEPEAAQPPADVGAVGSFVPFDDGTAAGTIMLKRIERIPAAQGGRADVRPSHGSFVVAHFKLSLSRGSALTLPSAFAAQTQDGTVHHGRAGVVEHPLNGGKNLIAAGQQTQGDVAFDIPAGPVRISYSPDGSQLVSFEVAG